VIWVIDTQSALRIARELDNDTRLAEATLLAGQFGVSFYDALYLALAAELEMRLVTADRQFHDRVVAGPVVVTYIGEL
jgi:predicted nucleic acid-binding protein